MAQWTLRYCLYLCVCHQTRGTHCKRKGVFVCAHGGIKRRPYDAVFVGAEQLRRTAAAKQTVSHLEQKRKKNLSALYHKANLRCRQRVRGLLMKTLLFFFDPWLKKPTLSGASGSCNWNYNRAASGKVKCIFFRYPRMESFQSRGFSRVLR